MKTLLLASLLFTSHSHAALKTESIEYWAGGAALEGYLAYDDAVKKPQAGIIIVHDWMGIGASVKEKADKLAKMGYIAFAADVYGKGNLPKDQKAAGALAGKFKADRKLLRERMQGALDTLLAMKNIDKKKTAVMGYCFGGTAALELARSGAPLAAVVSFHGGLSNPSPADAKNIKGDVLILHGADDPNVPPAEVKAFEDEMKAAKVKMQFVAYPGAVHSFTNPAAGNDISKGAAYNADADKKSWIEFERFLKRKL